MENQWESIFSYTNLNPDHPYLPNTNTSVFVLGDRYESVKDRIAIADRLRGLFWMTYRSGFPPIGTQNGPTSDTGWGCMHRCGQMMLAEAITRVQLGCDWRWAPGCEDDGYFELRRMFQDHKNSLYSIQNITLIGLTFDKKVGSWFGPNTVAQAIKKLCVYDTRIMWYVHIPVGDGIIMDEIKARCRKPVSGSWIDSETSSSFSYSCTSSNESTVGKQLMDEIKSRFDADTEIISHNSQASCPVTRVLDEDYLEILVPPTFEFEKLNKPISDNLAPSFEMIAIEAPSCSSNTTGNATTPLSPTVNRWRPLLLFIPLRLGLTQPNPRYFVAIKSVLKIKQCVGILGGRPNHALWIVGMIEDDDDTLLCLDPHTTQPASQEQLTLTDDLTHHCHDPVRMPLKWLDPSLVLGFVCPTEEDFEELCDALKRNVLANSGRHALFELHRTRPYNLPPIPTGPSCWSCCVHETNADHPLLISVQSEQDEKNQTRTSLSDTKATDLISPPPPNSTENTESRLG